MFIDISSTKCDLLKLINWYWLRIGTVQSLIIYFELYIIIFKIWVFHNYVTIINCLSYFPHSPNPSRTRFLWASLRSSMSVIWVLIKFFESFEIRSPLSHIRNFLYFDSAFSTHNFDLHSFSINTNSGSSNWIIEKLSFFNRKTIILCLKLIQFMMHASFGVRYFILCSTDWRHSNVL